LWPSSFVSDDGLSMPHRCRHIRGDGEASVPTGKSEERPGEADARESGAASRQSVTIWFMSKLPSAF